MTHPDRRILQHWAETLRVDSGTLSQPGLVVQIWPETDEHLIVHTVGSTLIASLPQQYEAALHQEGGQVHTLEALIHHLGVTATIAWRDFIYYATTPLDAALPLDKIRVLTLDDHALLTDLQAQCTADERDLSQISIVDALVVGWFDGDRLVGVGSLLERKHDIDDIGVITHPAYRGRQIAAQITVYLRNDIVRRGRVAQYITMEANRGSVRVAEKAQFELFVTEVGYTLSAIP